MTGEHAKALALMLHAGDRELLNHVARVAGGTPDAARAVAWLHEVLECGAASEQQLLAQGLTAEQLRALRLLTRHHASHSDPAYVAHVDAIARAAGLSGELARAVKLADLRDRLAHPRVQTNGWTPPYAVALARLE